MAFTRPLNELDSTHVAEAGGKGASLGELMQAGAPVPPGFVVISGAYKAFLSAGKHAQFVERIVAELDAGRIDAEDAARRIASHLAIVAVPSEVAEEIERATAKLNVPRVSVRSSATCEDGTASAWAGQLETYLNTTPADVVARVRDCWLSLFSHSALSYGAAHGYGAGQFAVAVVVQQMVNSDVSGIGFSVHPVTQEPNVQLIEACLGLGEAIVSGRIEPDQYVVERGNGTILETSVGKQREGLFMEPGAAAAAWRALEHDGTARKLNDEQVRQYAGMLERIHDHYGHPVDTEWALADGEFRLLQARPITTLADEYRETLIDASHPWEFLVRRPMSLVETSIWAHWLDSEHAGGGLEMRVDHAMSIQDKTGMANHFMSEPASRATFEHVSDLLRNDRAQLVNLLQRAHTVYQDSLARIEQGADAFEGLQEATDFYVHAAQFTTVLPSTVLKVYEREKMDDAEVRKLAEGLRAHTLYPTIQRNIIDTMLLPIARATGFSSPEEAVHVVLWSEVCNESLDREVMEARLAEAKAGRHFIFQTDGKQDKVRFVSQTGYLLMRLARHRHVDQVEHSDQLTGQAAWPGIYQGRARVVLSPDAVGVEFHDGEVLVSIQSSPALMPLLQRCGAVVTDEGGIVCHAAIIARELGKPTLIGTGRATSEIKTGDLVEVDTYAGVVKIIEHAK